MRGNQASFLPSLPKEFGGRRARRAKRTEARPIDTKQLPGAISMRITGARKGAKAKAKFWDYLPYTRIANWGRDFRNLDLYFVKNLFEATGLLTRKAKAQGLKVIPLMGWAARPG